MAPLTSGDAAPGFALADQAGNAVSVDDFKGQRLLVYFYPKADTPGCTAQACSVRDHRADLAKLGVAVVGISPDTPAQQSKFDQKYTLGFPLLSDPDHAVAEAWGVWGEKSRYGRTYQGIIRSAFLIDDNGRISRAWHNIKPEQTVPEVTQALAAQ
jgi:peroxiredoxin Q/BCP